MAKHNLYRYFTLRRVAWLAGVLPADVRALEQLVAPGGPGKGRSKLYTFADAAALRSASKLVRAGAPQSCLERVGGHVRVRGDALAVVAGAPAEPGTPSAVRTLRPARKRARAPGMLTKAMTSAGYQQWVQDCVVEAYYATRALPAEHHGNVTALALWRGDGREPTLHVVPRERAILELEGYVAEAARSFGASPVLRPEAKLNIAKVDAQRGGGVLLLAMRWGVWPGSGTAQVSLELVASIWQFRYVRDEGFVYAGDADDDADAPPSAREFSVAVRPSALAPPADEQEAAQRRTVASVCVARGFAEHQGGKYRAARASFEEAVKLDPSLARAWHGLGRASMALKIPGWAVVYFQEALARAGEGDGWRLQAQRDLACAFDLLDGSGARAAEEWRRCLGGPHDREARARLAALEAAQSPGGENDVRG
jgi:hypothetical protein